MGRNENAFVSLYCEYGYLLERIQLEFIFPIGLCRWYMLGNGSIVISRWNGHLMSNLGNKNFRYGWVTMVRVCTEPGASVPA